MADEAEQALGELREYLEGAFQQERVEEDDLTEEILAIILILYLLGGGYEDESQLTNDDKKKLEETYQLTLSAVEGMVDRHSRDMDMQYTVERIINHVYGIFFFAFAINGMDATKMYVWNLGDTEHCVDCLEQAAKGPMSGNHWAEMALAGIYPRSPTLFCTGLHCECTAGEE